jgi:hypothetical protein
MAMADQPASLSGGIHPTVSHTLFELNHEEERHVQSVSAVKFLRGVNDRLHGQGLSTSAA